VRGFHVNSADIRVRDYTEDEWLPLVRSGNLINGMLLT
jgi:hypothetical protein